jgi:ribonuclease HI
MSGGMKHSQWKLCIDGASRNNPGPSGAGVYLTKNGIPVIKQGFFLGIKTNNEAEYLALLLGLYFARQHMQPGEKLLVVSDSQLLIRQLEGRYKITKPHLKALYDCAQDIIHTQHYAVEHVLREYNTIADQLANDGVDSKNPVPTDFLSICSVYS